METYQLLMIIVFGLGILAISLEDVVRINKGSIALMMATVLWAILTFSTETESGDIINDKFVHHLGDVSETLFFVLGTMLIVRIVDKYGGFQIITDRLQNNSKRSLLLFFVGIAFVTSALLDNIAAVLVLLSILHRMVPNEVDRLKYACMIVIAANAGGSWSPIGDVTTLLLWTSGRLSPLHQMGTLILPAIVNLVIPTTIAYFWLFKGNKKLREVPVKPNVQQQAIGAKSQRVILVIGCLSLSLVPVFQIVTGLAPFLCVLFGLAILWIYTDTKFFNVSKVLDDNLRVVTLMKKLDVASIFFLLGVLMSVAALNVGGVLSLAASAVDRSGIPPLGFSTMLGMASSFTDNVALVAGTMGMYPLDSATLSPDFFADGMFWTSVAYTAVTGGSLLIIGSAAGVTAMGLEKISFGYYFKRFSGLALAGYVGGLLTLWLELHIG